MKPAPAPKESYAVISVGIVCLVVGGLLVATYWYMVFTPPLAFVGLMICVVEWRRHSPHRQCPVAQLAAIGTFANLGLFLLTFGFLLAQAMPHGSRKAEETKTAKTKQDGVPNRPEGSSVPRKTEEEEMKPRDVPNWPGTARYGAAGGDTRWPPGR